MLVLVEWSSASKRLGIVLSFNSKVVFVFTYALSVQNLSLTRFQKNNIRYLSAKYTFICSLGHCYDNCIDFYHQWDCRPLNAPNKRSLVSLNARRTQRTDSLIGCDPQSQSTPNQTLHYQCCQCWQHYQHWKHWQCLTHWTRNQR